MGRAFLHPWDKLSNDLRDRMRECKTPQELEQVSNSCGADFDVCLLQSQVLLPAALNQFLRSLDNTCPGNQENGIEISGVRQKPLNVNDLL